MMNLDDLDIVTACEEGTEVKYRDITIKVLGQHAPKVRKAQIIYFKKTEALRNKELSDEEFAQGAEDYEIARAAARIGGWEGIKQEYTPELAEKLCKINPEIRLLVLQESDRIENFTIGK